MAASAGGSITPLFRDYRSQEPRVSQECQKAKPRPGPLDSLLYSILICHHLSTRRQKYQGGLPLPYSCSWRALHFRTNSSSSRPREPHPEGPGRTDPCRHSQWDWWMLSLCHLLITYPPENWYPYQSPVVHGPTSEWTLPQIFQTPMDSTAFYSFSPRLPQLWNPERYSLSDPGPQFIYHVWKAFLKLLGISISLSSGYHPRPMVRLSGRYRR